MGNAELIRGLQRFVLGGINVILRIILMKIVCFKVSLNTFLKEEKATLEI